MDNRNERQERIQKIRESMMSEYGVIGKIPPQAIDFEEAVIGAILFESKVLTKVSDILSPNSFYKEAHARIFEVITDLGKTGQPIDLLTVSQALRKKGELELVGGSFFLSQLTEKVAGTSHVETWARVIAEKHMFRELIRISNDAIRDAYSDETDLFDLLDTTFKGLNSIIENNVKGDAVLLSSLSKEMLDNIQSRNANDNYMSGVSTKIMSVDKILGGYKKSDLVYIAGRPSMGKTGYVISNALEQARAGHVVAIFSIEMSKGQVRDRIVSQITGIDLEIIMNQQLDADRLDAVNRACGEIDRLKLYIDDTPALSVYDFQAKTARLKKRQKVEVVYVDYVQLMTLGAASKKLVGSREQEVAQISRTLKQVAKEHNIPVVALAQLSRGVESRAKSERIPMLSDLRESGSLEQDADVVAFIYRPEYYGIAEQDNGETTKGLAEFIVAKHRNGKLGTAKMQFTEYTAKFGNKGLEGPEPDSRIEPNKDFLKKTAPF